jgi:preprotein translocase subunit SecA
MKDLIRSCWADSNERKSAVSFKSAALVDALASVSAADRLPDCGKTAEFKNRLRGRRRTQDDLLPEPSRWCGKAAGHDSAAGVRDEIAVGMSSIRADAEMRTGEGKTLAATFPAYLNALTGQGVHIVTVNDYLARRDSQWMGKIYRFLGMEVGLVISQMEPAAKKASYAADITYGTNNEYGFDYLRDNMVIHRQNRVQRELQFAIIDEVDSILIDRPARSSSSPARGKNHGALRPGGSFCKPPAGRGGLRDRREAQERDPHRRGRPQGRTAFRRGKPVGYRKYRA